MAARALPRYAVVTSNAEDPASDTNAFPQARAETMEQAERERSDLIGLGWEARRVMIREGVPESIREREAREARERDEFLGGLKAGDGVRVLNRNQMGDSPYRYSNGSVESITKSMVRVLLYGAERPMRFRLDTGLQYGVSLYHAWEIVAPENDRYVAWLSERERVTMLQKMMSDLKKGAHLDIASIKAIQAILDAHPTASGG